MALVSLWPAHSRPYIGGSTSNSLLQLALGYNGIERMVGGSGGGAGGRGHKAGNLGAAPAAGPDVARVVPAAWATCSSAAIPVSAGCSGMSMGTEASWLLPAALIGLVAVSVADPKVLARTGRVRASLLLWGGWLLVTAAVFSFMDGIIHPYYTVALAPAIAALVGISLRELWRVREHLGARLVLAVMSAGYRRLGLCAVGSHPGLAACAAVDRACRFGRARGHAGRRRARRGPRDRGIGCGRNSFRRVGASAAYAVETVATAHNGPISTSGPSKGDAFGGPGQGGPGGPGGPGGHGGPGGRIAENAALAEMVQGLDNRLGRGRNRFDGGQRSGAEDRRLDHGDRWLHRQF